MGSLSRAEPTTRPSLLIRLRDSQDHEAWQSFNRLYGPLIFEFCRCRGLQDQDAAEVMQETLLQISKSIKSFEYERERGKFRGWVGSVARSKLVEFYRRQRRLPKQQDDAVEHLSESTDSSWNEVWLEHVVHAALAKVQQRLASLTWDAFRAVWLDDSDPQTVASDLGRDIAWVYLAKSRGLNLLREEVSFLADEPLQSFDSVMDPHHAVSDHARPAS